MLWMGPGFRFDRPGVKGGLIYIDNRLALRYYAVGKEGCKAHSSSLQRRSMDGGAVVDGLGCTVLDFVVSVEPL